MLPKELLKEVRRIEIKTRQFVDSLYSGTYRSVFKGRGIEFAGIRKYYRGDDFRNIDWKVSARSGKLHIREHIEERELQVVVALDLSASMAFGSGSREKRETAVEFAAAMALVADRNNDRAGVCLFTDKAEKFIPPSKGKTHILHLIRELLYYIPQRQGTDLKAPLDFLNSALSRRSVVFLVTDALNAGEIESQLKIASFRHDLILVLVRDKRESDLPDVGLIELEDPETGEEIVFDTSDRRLVEEFKVKTDVRDREFEKMCKNLGIDMIKLSAGKSIVEPVCCLFSNRSAAKR
ncbi:MAG: DUF58 domain-containing protein [Candidatus Ozemobacteraceae bacterium]|nr:DUF58 domain-containing protein [Candidatus Riflebacteria bacterium]